MTNAEQDRIREALAFLAECEECVAVGSDGRRRSVYEVARAMCAEYKSSQGPAETYDPFEGF